MRGHTSPSSWCVAASFRVAGRRRASGCGPSSTQPRTDRLLGDEPHRTWRNRHSSRNSAGTGRVRDVAEQIGLSLDIVSVHERPPRPTTRGTVPRNIGYPAATANSSTAGGGGFQRCISSRTPGRRGRSPGPQVRRPCTSQPRVCDRSTRRSTMGRTVEAVKPRQPSPASTSTPTPSTFSRRSRHRLVSRTTIEVLDADVPRRPPPHPVTSGYRNCARTTTTMRPTRCSPRPAARPRLAAGRHQRPIEGRLRTARTRPPGFAMNTCQRLLPGMGAAAAARFRRPHRRHRRRRPPSSPVAKPPARPPRPRRR